MRLLILHCLQVKIISYIRIFSIISLVSRGNVVMVVTIKDEFYLYIMYIHTYQIVTLALETMS